MSTRRTSDARFGHGERADMITLVAVGSLCIAVLVAAVVSVFAGGSWTLLVVLGWLLVVVAGCFVYCWTRVLRRR